MPDEPTQPNVPEEGGDLTARLKRLEEQAAAEPVAPPVEDEPTLAQPVPEPAVDPVAEAVAEPAVDPVAEPVAEVPPAKAPVKRATKKAAVPPSTPPIATPVKKAPAKKSPAAKRTPAKKVAIPDIESRPLTPWPVAQAPLPPVAPPRPAPVPAAVPTAPVERAARERDGLLRFLVVLAVLLLAAAAGLGAAALVEHRDSTYRAEVVVQLSPGPDPAGSVDDAIASGVTSYASKASSHAFTVTAAQRASVSTADVKGDIVGEAHGKNQVRLAVLAETATQARTLAVGAGDALVELVNEDQAVNEPSAGDRLSAAVQGEPAAAVKTAPDDSDAWIAGGLAAAAVLVLSGLAVVLRHTRRS